METGLFIQSAPDVGTTVVTAESLDMLLRTAAEVRTPECVILRALDVLSRSASAGPVTLNSCAFGDTTDKSIDVKNVT